MSYVDKVVILVMSVIPYSMSLKKIEFSISMLCKILKKGIPHSSEEKTKTPKKQTPGIFDSTPFSNSKNYSDSMTRLSSNIA